MQADNSTRRRLLLAGAAAVAGAALVPRPVSAAGMAGGAELSMPQPGDRNVIDQIVRIYGGWDYDQDAAEKTLEQAAEGSRQTLPAAVRAYRRRAHGIQCAMQAEKHGADEPMIVAALLHDIGHVFSPEAPIGTTDYDDKHEIYGTLWLRNAFVAEVTEPILRHVPGKRYLVSTRKEYWDRLSQGSKDSLVQQGGKMSPQELEAFEFMSFSREGVTLRLWDDDAKVKGLKLAPIERYLKALEASLRKPA